MVSVVLNINRTRQFVEGYSARLEQLGIEGKELIKLAFGFAVFSIRKSSVTPTTTTGLDIIAAAQRLLQNRLPEHGQSIYARNHPAVLGVVDLIGEISQVLADDLLLQLGQVPPNTYLDRFVGPDLIVQLPNPPVPQC